MDSREVEVRFSPEVRRAFGDLEAAVHFSEHFDSGVREILKEWADGKTVSIHTVLTALPLLAEETFTHVRATGDERAAEAWRDICNMMPEKGFTLAENRSRGR